MASQHYYKLVGGKKMRQYTLWCFVKIVGRCAHSALVSCYYEVFNELFRRFSGWIGMHGGKQRIQHFIATKNVLEARIHTPYYYGKK